MAEFTLPLVQAWLCKFWPHVVRGQVREKYLGQVLHQEGLAMSEVATI